ncbi:glutaredoxin-related protein 5, mitochondrial-like isoform X2 [Panonychus citri]|uniref:glutaredoxin-related protein 5, mitochondrial-like isoform X2 n=1 Tax=Panonychus citri TaxID=50023 RepID=UPI00230747E3|nr:glutaredoxin-related protein 5, mitochondrial-like isoform X2 [Panonychus citri]XP_053210904.1 glutaredoxin-related protein 5, mitochondrial-like isoform X2 [Panonychus citri]
MSLLSSFIRTASRVPTSISRTQFNALFSTSPEWKEKLDKMVSSNKVVVFMKGVPNAPRCGFSNAVTQVLRMHGVDYDAHDVLSDEDLRQAIKDYTNWPTIPQIYINGQFVGGCDIILQMHKTGELIDMLKTIGIKSALSETESQ